jgi:transcriptional regulator with XRE-family HTH domain
MDIEAVRSQLLKSLRGDRSQNYLSRKLGYRFNQVYRWETGHTKIPWPSFVRLCQICKIDLGATLKNTLGFVEKPERCDLLVKNITAPASQSYMSKKVGVSRFVLSHWISGRTTPSLDDILRLVDKVTFALVEFVGGIAKIDTIPALRKDFEKREARKRILVRYPFLEAALACLELVDYQRLKKHQEGFISDRIGISLEEEKKLLSELKQVGTLLFKEGRFVFNESALENFDIRGDFQAVKGIKKYYIERATNKLLKASENSRKDLFIYYTFSVDEKAAAQINKEAVEFLKRVIEISEQRPKEPTQVRVLNMHFLDLR